MIDIPTRHNEMLEQFDEFHKKHPEVWEMFQHFAFEKIRQGFQHYSANGIFERIRWETAKPETDPGDFKLNNNYRSFYARWFMVKYPMYEGFFRIREQTSLLKPPTKKPPLRPRDFR